VRGGGGQTHLLGIAVDESEHHQLHADVGVSVLSQLFIKSFCRSQLPHRSVNLSFNITDIKNKFTDLYGN